MELMQRESSPTPASDKVFGTRELAEMILTELPLADLLSAMRVCTDFYDAIKTTKAIIRNKCWLSSSLVQIHPDLIDEDTNEVLADTKLPMSEPPAPFQRGFLSFRTTTTNRDGNSLMEMFGLPKVLDGKLQLCYASSAHIYSLDTIIRTYPDSSDELWRLLAITDMSGGTDVTMQADKFSDCRTVHLDKDKTLWDLYEVLHNALADHKRGD